MSTLAVVVEILTEAAVPMSVREIVDRAGTRLPSKSNTPDTVVARDLSMDIKRKGESSLFVRTAPGRYTLRALTLSRSEGEVALAGFIEGALGVSSMIAGTHRKPALAASQYSQDNAGDAEHGGSSTVSLLASSPRNRR